MGYATITAIFAASYAGSLPALWLTARSDRTGRRTIVLAGGFLMAVSLAGFAAATSTLTAASASLLWGFGGSLLVHGCELELAAVPAGAPDGELHRRLRASNLWGTVGDVAGPLLLAGVLGLGWSWRVAFGLAAAATTAYVAGLARYPFAPPAAVDEDDEAGSAPAWRDPEAWRLGVYAFLLMPFDETWLAFLIAWLQVDGGLSGSTAALAGIVATLGAAIGFGPVGAHLGRRSDRSVLVTVGLVLAVAGSVVAGVPVGPAVAAGLVVNAGTAAAWLTVQHAALTLRPSAAGQVLSLVNAIEHTTVVLPVALGLVADRYGLGTAFSAYLALGLALAVVGGTTGSRRPVGRAPLPAGSASEGEADGGYAPASR